jgi:hypothetical protein
MIRKGEKNGKRAAKAESYAKDGYYHTCKGTTNSFTTTSSFTISCLKMAYPSLPNFHIRFTITPINYLLIN